jgi:hypothetical protein
MYSGALSQRRIQILNVGNTDLTSASSSWNFWMALSFEDIKYTKIYLVLSQINKIKYLALLYATWSGPQTSVWILQKGVVARVYDLVGKGECLMLARAQIEQSHGASGNFILSATALDNPLTPMCPIRRCKNPDQ